MARIKTRKKTRADLHAENTKLKAEVTRLKALKEPRPPSEAELNARRERLIAELCGIANSFTVDDYDPVKLARVIEEEKREMGWHGDDGSETPSWAITPSPPDHGNSI